MGFLEQLFCQNSWGSTLKYFRKTALEGEESLEYSSENWFSLGKISLWTRAIESFNITGRFGSEESRLGRTRARRKTWHFSLLFSTESVCSAIFRSRKQDVQISDALCLYHSHLR